MVVLRIDNPQNDISELLFTPVAKGNKRTVLFSASRDDDANDGQQDYYIGPIHVTRENVSHGFGVVASRDIKAGECLFVTRAAVSADIHNVFEEWKSKYTSASSSEQERTTQTLLEHVSEEVLVQSMRDVLRAEEDEKKSLAQSFLLQVASGENSRIVDVPPPGDELMMALVGKSKNLSSQTPDVDDSKLLEIIRRNAFGPEFVSYESAENRWKVLIDSSSTITTVEYPSRLLGLYPLAAMINHSCVPNAIRVFACGDYMIVHSCSSIKKGEEIVWSYLPPVLPFPQRRQQLKERHGFVCRCVRCQNEESAAAVSDIFNYPTSLEPFAKGGGISAVNTDPETRLQFAKDLLDWEEHLFSDAAHSNETKRYWKMGNVNLYIDYLNSVLVDMSNRPREAVDDLRESVLKTAMEMHFCFVSCCMASTEHLSVLHLCYDLVSVMHSRAVDQSKTLPKVRFWTEQLKRAHMTRYGSLGNNVEKIRGVMKHTQLVLRNQNGLEAAPVDFI